MVENAMMAATAREHNAGRAGRLTILHVTAPASYGGLERVVDALASGQAASGHRVIVAATVAGEGEDHGFLGALRQRPVELVVLSPGGRGYIKEWRSLRQLMRRVRPDVVHTHGYRSDIIGGRAARAEGVPVVSTTHGFSRGGWKNRLYESLQRRELRRFNAVAAVSKPMGDELVRSGIDASRVRVLPNATPVSPQLLSRIEARRELCVPQDGFRIGWVGRFSWAKGLDVFVQALACLPHNSDWHVSIVGSGEDAPGALSLASKLGVADRITWHGVIADAARLLRAFDVLVISSRTEGTPITLLETMAAGVPLVCTSVGGIPDVVRDEDALLVAPSDPTALAAAIENVRTHSSRARERAASANRRLATFTTPLWLHNYDSLYYLAQGVLLRESSS